MQTIKYLASKYLFSKVVWHQPETQNIEDAFASGMLAAQRWIPVEDELPEYKGENFAIIGKHKNFELPIMIHIESHEDVLSIVDEFTHWRPIEYPIL